MKRKLFSSFKDVNVPSTTLMTTQADSQSSGGIAACCSFWAVAIMGTETHQLDRLSCGRANTPATVLICRIMSQRSTLPSWNQRPDVGTWCTFIDSLFSPFPTGWCVKWENHFGGQGPHHCNWAEGCGELPRRAPCQGQLSYLAEERSGDALLP